MKATRWTALILIMLLGLTGCSKYVLVPYNDVEKTNSVRIALNSGSKVDGTVYKTEPHQLSVLTEDRRKALIPKDNIASVKRLPPVYDSFGKGISELEIDQEKTGKNALIYGVGGGALSFGASFFLGSMLAADSTRDGGAILAGTMGGIGIPATVLFVRAGAAKDRKEAIGRINDKRISAKLEETKTADPDKTGKLKDLQQEKEKQEQLRKERQRLLEKLNEEKKKK